MNRKVLTLGTALVLLVATLAGCAAPGASNPPASLSTSGSAPGAGSVLPIAADPIVNASTTAGLTITSAAVEDNVDPVTNKALSDRLQITLGNSTAAPLSQVEIYYEMTDVTTKQSEGYHMNLAGVTVPAKGEATVFFDNEAATGHFPENEFSLYRSSTNQVDFTIEASAVGVAIATGAATKGAGTGEQAD
ncbi:MAG: hypothetical protein JWP30_341 [Homoserinimonas sp.]|jgi:hypothetical protein|nr:hypothetical protein [Homoserinimonas sp.]